MINRAFNKAEEKRSVVEQLVMAVDDLNLQLQLAKELQTFRNFAEFERLSVLAVQIGRSGKERHPTWLRLTCVCRMALSLIRPTTKNNNSHVRLVRSGE